MNTPTPPKLNTRNLHTFSRFGYHMAYDIDHLHIYRIDALATEILNRCNGKTPPQLESQLTGQYTSQQIRHTMNNLLKAGLIGFGAPPDTAQPRPDKKEDIAGATNTKTAKPAKKTGLTKLVLAVTDSCNLSCRYCLSSLESFSSRSDMTPETARQAVDFLLERMGDNPRANIVFYGGEPLLNYRCIVQTHRYAQEKSKEAGKTFTYTIITNGTLLTEDICDFLVQHRFAIGLSFDGDQTIHDANRVYADGTGTHRQVYEGYKRLAQRNADVTPQAVLSGSNPDILAVVDSLHQQGVANYKLLPCMLADGSADLLESEPDAYSQRYEHMVAQKLKEAEDAPTLLPIDTFALLEMIDSGRKAKTSCSAVNGQLAVAANGDIYPCDNFLYTPEFKLGNVFRGITKDMSRVFRSIRASELPKCRDCWARNLCGGPCPYFSMRQHRQLDIPVDSFCYQKKQAVEIALAVYTTCKSKNKHFLQQWLKRRFYYNEKADKPNPGSHTGPTTETKGA